MWYRKESSVWRRLLWGLPMGPGNYLSLKNLGPAYGNEQRWPGGVIGNVWPEATLLKAPVIQEIRSLSQKVNQCIVSFTEKVLVWTVSAGPLCDIIGLHSGASCLSCHGPGLEGWAADPWTRLWMALEALLTSWTSYSKLLCAMDCPACRVYRGGC